MRWREDRARVRWGGGEMERRGDGGEMGWREERARGRCDLLGLVIGVRLEEEDDVRVVSLALAQGRVHHDGEVVTWRQHNR